eukprot:scaffold10157_cov162-Amphora_coffeaeformis.AAC.1
MSRRKRCLRLTPVFCCVNSRVSYLRGFDGKNSTMRIMSFRAHARVVHRSRFLSVCRHLAVVVEHDPPYRQEHCDIAMHSSSSAYYLYNFLATYRAEPPPDRFHSVKRIFQCKFYPAR